MQPSLPSEPGVSPGYPPSPRYVGPRPRNVVVILLFFLAGLLLLVGVVVLQARVLVEPPTGNPPDYTAWARTIRVMGFTGLLLLNVGVFFFLVGGILVGLFRSDLPDTVRRSMIVMPGVLVIIWLLGFLLVGSAFAPPFIP